MCGIVGIVSLVPRDAGVDVARLRRMRDTLGHRGPDGAGLHVEGGVGLGHRRLSIVDVEGGSQPMANEDGTIWIVFNGEIYNHAALRPGLQQKGHRYSTRSDTETILHLYEEEGEACVERLQGMFAFAIWDRGRRSLLLARDRLGIKPLYYALRDRELLFASEIKAILAAGGAQAALREEALPELLATRFVAGEQTLFQGIRQLAPGRTLSWSPGQPPRQRRYWTIPASRPDEPGSVEEHAAELRQRLRAAVQSHLMSDVPLGLFLSGGIDSSGLLALMAPLVDGPVRTFAVGFDEPGANELAYARLAAKACGSEHREIVVRPEEFWTQVPKLVWHEDAPLAFPSSVPLYCVSRLAQDHVKVVLTGEGADELFLGYGRYRATAWNEKLGGTYREWVPAGLRSAVRHGLGLLPRSLRRWTGRSFLTLAPDPRSLFYENFAVFPLALQRGLLRPDLLEGRDPYAAELAAYHEGEGDNLERMSRADLQTYLVRLLMKQDQMSMAASIESRVPYLDHEVVEHVASLPGRFKLQGLTTKAVLRAALRDVLPPPILKRRKMGFPVPVGGWLRGSFWPLVEDLVLGPRALARGHFLPDGLRRLAEEHRRGAADHADRLWLLMNLEIWHRVCIDGETAAAVIRAA